MSATAPRSRTAEYMALFRALETVRPDGVVRDPLAERFLGPTTLRALGISRHALARRCIVALVDQVWPGARSSGVARTRAIDLLVLEALDGGATQLVLLGAGFDTRAHRLPIGESTSVFEVDRAETQEWKRERLRGHAHRRGLHYVPCDFERQDVARSLEAAGFEHERATVFVLEGVTNYLSREANRRLFSFVASTRPGNTLVATYVSEPAPADASEPSLALEWLLRRSDESWVSRFDPAELRRLWSELGLETIADRDASEVRRTVLGDPGRGYEFYRLAVARVATRRDADD